ncbi:MAG TPA: sugar phosphate isomerase/epimerase family protein [Thermodesulfobacteriota bacterium]|nr:sugar phosphate isomerase/epimerase family protein [Thermodesulfobacteriota bacterium]
MKIGCNTVDFRKHPFEKALQWICEAGYEYVEVEANLSWCDHADPYRDDPVQFKEKIASFGFKGISGLGSHRELITDDQGAKDLEHALLWAKAAEIPVVLTGEGRLPEGMSEEEGLKILKGRLERLTAVAEKNRVYLAMEPHGSISLKPGGLPKILSLVKSPWLGVNFDTANPHRGTYVGTTRKGFEWKLAEKSQANEVVVLTPVAHLVRHVHIKDVIGKEAVALGKGKVDLMECLKILKKNGFEGVLSYETEGNQSEEEAKEMIAESRKFMIDALKQLG